MLSTTLVHAIFIALVLAWASPFAQAETAASAEANMNCVVDRQAMLASDVETFDQSFEHGWRSIANKEGCRIAAANLIAEYRLVRTDLADSRRKFLLIWHEGQLRAFEGQTDQAIALFEQTYRGPPERRTESTWDLYVHATVAFLEKDRATFDAAYRDLLELPEPESWAETVARTKAAYNYEPVWPSNLNVFEAFERCFEKSYEEAYSQCNRGIGR